MNKLLNILTIKKFIENIDNNNFHRSTSWDNCYQAFSVDQPTEYHSLQLGFYLASWGMYRGSSGLLQKNHLIHEDAVGIIFSDEFKTLKCTASQEVEQATIPHILDLKKALDSYYRKADNSISPTDTLLSKIMLGTMGCVPAYDRYFVIGLNEAGMKYSRFQDKSLKELFDFIDFNRETVLESQQMVQDRLNRHYPVMKIIDMYFWQLGYDLKK